MNLNNIDEITDKVVTMLKDRITPSFLVESSGRHIHLSEKDMRFLMGDYFNLAPVKFLSQPGQFASQVRLTVLGPKGALHNVVVLGPTRNETQVELSLTDARKIGVKAPIRLSGDLENTPGITILNGHRALTIEKGVIIAKRHIHVKTSDAELFGVQHNDIVKVKVEGERPLVFDDVVVRVDDNFNTAMHIDFDEANACGFRNGIRGTIVKESLWI